MLIKIKNPKLYEIWMNYYEKFHPEMKPAAKRTYAFLNSNEGTQPPIIQ